MNQKLKKITDASDICFSKSHNLVFSDYHVAKKAPRKFPLPNLSPRRNYNYVSCGSLKRRNMDHHCEKPTNDAFVFS